MKDKARIYVAGHRGLVGSALVRRLRLESDAELILRTRAELDLTDQEAVGRFFASERPDQVYMAAARVGGIMANSSRPAEFIYENLAIQTNVIDASYRSGVKKLMLLGSNCIYPKLAEQPVREESLLTGSLEPTNEPYAIAKIAGIQMCQAYRRQYGFDAISAMPANLYGPGDNFDLQAAHVMPALLRKCVEAVAAEMPEVDIWGTGKALREFMHADDLADACVFLMRGYSDPMPINVGWGQDVSIRVLTELIAEATGFKGQLRFDTSKPDGHPRKLLDVSRIAALGWRPKIGLREGIRNTVDWYRGEVAKSPTESTARMG